jgi:hypothetical protein
VIEDDAPPPRDGHGIGGYSAFVTEPGPDMAHHDVIGSDDKRMVAQGYASTGRRLTCYRDEASTNGQGRGEPDCSADIENNRAGSVSLDSGPEAAGTCVGEGRDPKDPTSAPSNRMTTRALGPGKGPD